MTESRVHEFYMLSPFNATGAIHAARQGDEEARNVLQAVPDAMREIKERPKGKRLKCLNLDCETEFSAAEQPIAFAVAIPMFPKDDDQLVAMGVCLSCIRRCDNHIREAVLKAVQQHWPHATYASLQ
jgi:hypothetical protein